MNGIKIYYFIPDFEVDNGIWKNILKDYLMKYTVEDKILLVLEINNDNKYKVELEWICNCINHIGDSAAGVIKNNNPIKSKINKYTKVNAIPPINPSQLFLGEKCGESLCLPNFEPIKKAPAS